MVGNRGFRNDETEKNARHFRRIHSKSHIRTRQITFPNVSDIDTTNSKNPKLNNYYLIVLTIVMSTFYLFIIFLWVDTRFEEKTQHGQLKDDKRLRQQRIGNQNCENAIFLHSKSFI